MSEAIFRGVSGRLHRFSVHRPHEAFDAEPGVYCFARPGPGGRGWTPLFLSRTGNLSKRLAHHEQWGEAQLLGATHILIHDADERDVREYVESDLAGALRPVMNGPVLDAELTEAAEEAGIRLVWAAQGSIVPSTDEVDHPVPRHLTEPGVAARLKSDRAASIARRLRREMTPAEKALQFELRRLAVGGSHFRKQSPLGPFIVDFVCHGAALASNQTSARMMRRMWLSAMWNGRDGIEGRGYRVLRFKNADVLCNPGAVAKQIFAVVEQRTRRRL